MIRACSSRGAPARCSTPHLVPRPGHAQRVQLGGEQHVWEASQTTDSTKPSSTMRSSSTPLASIQEWNVQQGEPSDCGEYDGETQHDVQQHARV